MPRIQPSPSRSTTTATVSSPTSTRFSRSLPRSLLLQQNYTMESPSQDNDDALLAPASPPPHPKHISKSLSASASDHSTILQSPPTTPVTKDSASSFTSSVRSSPTRASSVRAGRSSPKRRDKNRRKKELEAMMKSVPEALRKEIFQIVILDAIKSLRQVDRTYKLFYKPVDEQDAPNYYEMVSNPICLEECEIKAHQMEYDTLERFDADVDRMYSNCLLYNSSMEGDVVQRTCRKQREQWQVKIKPMVHKKAHDHFQNQVAKAQYEEKKLAKKKQQEEQLMAKKHGSKDRDGEEDENQNSNSEKGQARTIHRTHSSGSSTVSEPDSHDEKEDNMAVLLAPKAVAASPKRRGRPPGSKNKNKRGIPIARKKRKSSEDDETGAAATATTTTVSPSRKKTESTSSVDESKVSEDKSCSSGTVPSSPPRRKTTPEVDAATPTDHALDTLLPLFADNGTDSPAVAAGSKSPKQPPTPPMRLIRHSMSIFDVVANKAPKKPIILSELIHSRE